MHKQIKLKDERKILVKPLTVMIVGKSEPCLWSKISDQIKFNYKGSGVSCESTLKSAKRCPYYNGFIIDFPEERLNNKEILTFVDEIISAVKSGKYCVVTTFRELVISRIRRRIAEGAFDYKDLQLLYVNGNRISEIHINEKGYFPNKGKGAWPKRLFNEGYEEAMALLKCMCKNCH